MKKLFLLRHAEAPGSYELADHERVLSDKGVADSQALGQFLRREDYGLDCVLCSSATRTKMTLNGALQSFDTMPDIRYMKGLYQGSTGDYFDALQQVEGHHDHVMMVGHNPVIHALAAMLAADGSAAYQKLIMQYPPGSLTVLQCDIASWANLQPRVNGLEAIVHTADYNSANT